MQNANIKIKNDNIKCKMIEFFYFLIFYLFMFLAKAPE
jgi:hypothetical protein